MHKTIGGWIVAVALFVVIANSWHYVNDYAIIPISDGIELHSTDPDYPVLAKWRNQYRTGVKSMADKMSSSDPGSPEDFYKKNRDTAQNLNKYRTAEEMLEAIRQGTMIPTGPVLSVEGRTSYWQATGLKVFKGQILCPMGTVSNDFVLSPDHKRIPVDPGGIDIPDIDGHTPFDPRFPMLALLVRVDQDEGQVFVLKECIASPYTGDVEIMPNSPYWGAQHLAATGFANHNNGRFLVRRYEDDVTTNPQPTVPVQAAPTPKPTTKRTERRMEEIQSPMPKPQGFHIDE